MNQLAIPLLRVPEAGTQNYQLLRAFKNGERLTVAAALEKYGIYALSQRCGELRRQGWPVVSEMVTLQSGRRVACYWME